MTTRREALRSAAMAALVSAGARVGVADDGTVFDQATITR